VLAVDDLGQRADGWARRLLALRAWLADPLVLAAGGGVLAFLFSAGRRRRPLLRGLRWAWWAWRLWRRQRPVSSPRPDA
jgi:hypothetical protein